MPTHTFRLFAVSHVAIFAAVSLRPTYTLNKGGGYLRILFRNIHFKINFKARDAQAQTKLAL